MRAWLIGWLWSRFRPDAAGRGPRWIRGLALAIVACMIVAAAWLFIVLLWAAFGRL